MMDAIKLFLFFVDVFFVIYLIGYSTFLFLSVVVGASELYEKRMDEKMKGTLRHDFYIPISIYYFLALYFPPLAFSLII